MLSTPEIAAMVLAGVMFVPFCSAAKKIGLVDRPKDRKQHEQEVPLVGGVTIALAVFLSLLLTDVPFSDFRVFFFSLVILLIVGLLDDHRDIPAWSKFLAQFFLGLLLVFDGNVIIPNVGDIFATGIPQSLGILAIPFSILAIVGVINSFNMHDGHDGVAGGSVILTLITVIALIKSSPFPAPEPYLVFVRILLVSVCVFEIFNLGGLFGKREPVFLGDAGSMFLGLAIVYLLIRLSVGPEPILRPATAPLFIAVPLLDMFGVIVNRLVSRKAIFAADRNHFHHVLLSFGLSNRAVFLVIMALQASFCLAGYAANRSQFPDFLIFWGFVLLVFVYSVGMVLVVRVRRSRL
jgi:UDP-GlcNAc:undecaprenyl-phosphate/decaprenyl-phosphate GlcNAc-1-phosphate transferase